MEEFTKKYEEILKLFCIEHPIGYSSKEIQEAEKIAGKIPAALRLFYEKYAKSEELQGLQDEMILPDYYPALLNDDYIVFFNENQDLKHSNSLIFPQNQNSPALDFRKATNRVRCLQRGF